MLIVKNMACEAKSIANVVENRVLSVYLRFWYTILIPGIVESIMRTSLFQAARTNKNKMFINSWIIYLTHMPKATLPLDLK